MRRKTKGSTERAKLGLDKENRSRPISVARSSPPDWASAAGFCGSDWSARETLRRPKSGTYAIFSATRPDDLLTVADVASRLRVSTKTVRRLIARGDLRVVRIGRAIRVRPEELKKVYEVYIE
jgi:excisionase family DNA binding protein